jgi:hypothetical protein
MSPENYLIRHHYDIGDRGVSVDAPTGFDVKRAAVYMQFKAEEWFGDDKSALLRNNSNCLERD